jgi:hypothetical protein
MATITILSIDGGGVRGLIPATFLMQLEARLPNRPPRCSTTWRGLRLAAYLPTSCPRDLRLKFAREKGSSTLRVNPERTTDDVACNAESNQWSSEPGGDHSYSFVRLALPSFATQMLAPSNATPNGRTPTAKVPRVAPSLSRSLVTPLSPWFVTQTFVPSKATF